MWEGNAELLKVIYGSVQFPPTFQRYSSQKQKNNSKTDVKVPKTLNTKANMIGKNSAGGVIVPDSETIQQSHSINAIVLTPYADTRSHAIEDPWKISHSYGP